MVWNPLPDSDKNIKCKRNEKGEFVCKREDGSKVNFGIDENDKLRATEWEGDPKTIKEIRNEVEGRKVIKIE